ncbi:MAG: hypothetical protein J5U17_07295 [Candidatus Methanoperedens sp.]|nr:hypothetical protein [Candidatus Methanoperedens sp.]MCE8429523.1 hypothetical protein [Candidatus Methanoperedens sp.]
MIKLENSSDRTIKENDLIYSTTATNVPFKYRSFGNYSVIGFMGEDIYLDNSRKFSDHCHTYRFSVS